MVNYMLNTDEEDDLFFLDCRLMAIGCSYSGHRLCWLLNHALDLDLKRCPDFDIYFGNLKKKHLSSGLFNEIDANISVEDFCYFPIYGYKYPESSSAGIYIYTNKQNGRHLLPELKQADYFILIQNASYVESEYDYCSLLSQIAEISWAIEKDVYKLKNKANLIF